MLDWQGFEAHSRGPVAPRAATRPGAGYPTTLSSYLRDIGSTPVLTGDQEIALAEELRFHGAALRRELLAVPLVVGLLVSRWRELRLADRVTATLSAVPADRRGPDASARIDATFERVSGLLERCAALEERAAPGARTARAQIRERVRELLLGAELAPGVFEAALGALRQHRAALARRRGKERARLEREVGLPAREFLSRMQVIEGHARAVEGARNRFAEHNLKLVVTVAKEFRGLGLSLADLIQEGNLGLLHAIDKFDPQRGFKFSTYGCWWIRQACIRAIQNHSRTVRLPSHVHTRLRQVENARGRLQGRLGRGAAPEELAAELGVSESEVETLTTVSKRPLSLDAPARGDEDRTVGDGIAGPASADPAETVHLDRAFRRLAGLLRRLPARERQVLRWRFGLAGERDHTLEEIGRRLSLSRERIRQIESAALDRLRAMAARQRPSRALQPQEIA